MGSRGRLLFDLNAPPTEDDEETDHIICLQPQKALPSVNTNTSNLFPASVGPEGIKNNNAFSHASSMSGFQPFARPKVTSGPEAGPEQKIAGNYQQPKLASPTKSMNGDNAKTVVSLVSRLADPRAEEREEGEWSDVEGSADAPAGSSLHELGKASQERGRSESTECSASGMAAENISGSNNVIDNIKVESGGRISQDLDSRLNDQKTNSSRNSNSNANGDASMDNQEENALVQKTREVKGVEASHALKCANNLGKRKIDQHKEAMLGKKRNRQTMLINIDEVKQAGPIKTSTPRRPPTTVRTVKEVRTVTPAAEQGEKHTNPMIKDQKQVDWSLNEGGTSSESCQPKSECNGDISSGQLPRPRRLNSDADLPTEGHLPPIPRQSSWKQPTDLRTPKSSQFSGRKPALSGQNSIDSKLGNKKNPPAKKPAATSNQYQDTSVERLIREVTNEKFWHHPGSCTAEEIPTTTCGGRHSTVRKASWMED